MSLELTTSCFTEQLGAQLTFSGTAVKFFNFWQTPLGQRVSEQASKQAKAALNLGANKGRV
jgi:hypothetical protein